MSYTVRTELRKKPVTCYKFSACMLIYSSCLTCADRSLSLLYYKQTFYLITSLCRKQAVSRCCTALSRSMDKQPAAAALLSSSAPLMSDLVAWVHACGGSSATERCAQIVCWGWCLLVECRRSHIPRHCGHCRSPKQDFG